MKIKDLINICIHNLFRHKSRTLLTILGVLIGCTSVVIMVSFGIGMRISQEAMLSQMGDLQIIGVRAGRDDIKLNEQTVTSLEKIDNVLAVNPKITMNDITTSIATGVNNRYKVGYLELTAIKPTAIDNFGYELLEGEAMGKSSSPNTIEAVAGQYFAYNLEDTLRSDGNNYIDYWSYVYNDDSNASGDMPKPFADPLTSEFTLTLGDDDPNAVDKTLTYKVKIVGVVKEDYNKGYETSSGLMISIDDMKKISKEYRQLNNIALKGSEDSYSEISVKADSIKTVAPIEDTIKAMGYSTDSMESIRKPMEKDVRQKQLMFAGLGVVSLFVAALGIMNTMIMAISERKREIGVMKALGCYIKDIKSMFLMEAGFIGFIGGILGSIFSLIVSAIINIVSTETEIANISAIYEILFTNTDRVSVVPLWLIISAVIFSIFVGVASGYYPANKAIQIPALDAIRAE